MPKLKPNKTPPRKFGPESTDPYESLNHLWLPLAPFRLKIAALVKEGNNEYPVGEILRMMKEIIDASVEISVSAS